VPATIVAKTRITSELCTWKINPAPLASSLVTRNHYHPGVAKAAEL
jgi:hypothetical protein